MYIIIFFILGLLLLVIGVYSLITFFKVKTVYENILDSKDFILLVDKGKYQIDFIGAKIFNNIDLKIKKVNENSLIKYNEFLFKYNSIVKYVFYQSYYWFEIKEKDNYELNFKIDNITAVNSKMIYSNINKPINNSTFNFRITNYRNPITFILGLVLSIIGLLLFTLSISLYFINKYNL